MPPKKSTAQPEIAQLAELETKLGYHFSDKDLLTTALTHQSALDGRDDGRQSYQRLEFLGDRVLGLAISDKLYRAQPEVIVGRLSRRLSDFVRWETCADVADDWALGRFIHFAANIGQETRQSRSVLADVCEAVLGAIYLDGGFDAAVKVIDTFWAPRLTQSDRPPQDPKTTLQEWVQARGLNPPVYRDLDRTGPDHEPVFTVTVEIPGFAPCEARAPSKKHAQQKYLEDLEVTEQHHPTRCGFVALIGAPNAGKSTLINQLVGTKVSIVSRKVQTTRSLVRGIALQGDAQIIFVDTPGIFAPKRRLDRAMVTSAWGGAGDADVIALLVDARRGLDEETRAIVEKLPELKHPKMLILNKIDTVESEKLLKLAQDFNEILPFAETFMISALRGYGVPRLLEVLGNAVQPGPWLYPEDQVSDAPLRALAAEITREKIFERLHDELPYQSTVETDSWKDQKDGSVRVEQTVYVMRDAHKKIIIGEGGRMLKSIGTAARSEICEIAETKVHLFLFVKVPLS
eukprot:gene6351-6418_t